MSHNHRSGDRVPYAAAAVTDAPTDREPLPDWSHDPSGANQGPRLVTGHLTGVNEDGQLLFLAEGSSGPPLPVAIGIPESDGVLVRAARRRQRALVARTSESAPRWVLVGLVRDRVTNSARDARPGALEVTVDGEKLKLEAEHDIELRCGQACITLRYDGRIELRGTHILSASRGPNRVKGATIALN